MKILTKKVYYCEHCKKHGLSKPQMIYHEKVCNRNPENKRSCFQCQNLIKKDVEVSKDYGHGETFETYNFLFCTEKNIFLHTPKNEIKKNFKDLGDELNEPMPKFCSYMKSNDIHSLIDSV